MRKTREAAFGRWGSILSHLGFGDLLDGKHRECPICSAKNKFRYTDYKSNGEWICVCSQGDGFDLIMQTQGVTFTGAARQVDQVIGNEDCEETFKPEVDYEKRRRDLNNLWADADRHDLVLGYLQGRGISTFGNLRDLRGHPSMYNADTKDRRPGMCALIRNKLGEPVSIHRTFFDPKAKKIMPPTEKISGAGIRLGSFDGDSLVIGEGIETTLKGTEQMGVPGLAAISAHGMETLIIPARFTKVMILADNDASFTGQKSAFILARKCDAEKRSVTVAMSPTLGDILDLSGTGRKTLQWSNKREG